MNGTDTPGCTKLHKGRLDCGRGMRFKLFMWGREDISIEQNGIHLLEVVNFVLFSWFFNGLIHR